HPLGDPTTPSELDSAACVPKGVVVDPWFDWSGDQPPSTPPAQTVIYEADVRALTASHPDVPEETRGSYAALAHPAVVGHLTRLGVTAVNLRCVQQFVPARSAARRATGLPIGLFAPHNGYGAWPGAGQPAQEFRHMVKALHAAGIEVLIGVAFHRTAEAGDPPVVVSFRGIDNAVYYGAGEPGGGAAVLDLRHPAVLRLVMDSLRHWVEVLHVDGFCFRPAPSAGPGRGGDNALPTPASTSPTPTPTPASSGAASSPSCSSPRASRCCGAATSWPTPVHRRRSTGAASTRRWWSSSAGWPPSGAVIRCCSGATPSRGAPSTVPVRPTPPGSTPTAGRSPWRSGPAPARPLWPSSSTARPSPPSVPGASGSSTPACSCS